MELKYGYLKGLTEEKDCQKKSRVLRDFGCKKKFRDTTDSAKSRTELEKMLYGLHKGDVVVV
jgi:DNA invertase Pin-like site-specific DNA recombinase